MGSRNEAGNAAGEARRVFLGWDGRDGPDGAWRSRLAAAAEWIAADFVGSHGADLSRVHVVTPAGRAARRLEQLVARALAGAGAAHVPARYGTVGRLVDGLLAEPVAGTGRLARTLAWAAALRTLSGERLRRLHSRPPEAEDAAGRHRLAGELRALHGRLAPEELEFADVHDALASTPDADRWDVLAGLQAAYRQALSGAGLTDPHDARRSAVEQGRLDVEARVILVGVPELNALTRRALAALGSRVEALVFAPEGMADSFDGLGAVLTDAWDEAEVRLDEDRWHVEDGPGDQADAVLEILAGHGGRYSAAEITLGVPDGQVVPELEGRLPAVGVPARSAAGRSLRDTAPWQLLDRAAAWLSSGRFGDLAALVRHPELHRALQARIGHDPASLCDAYAGAHLPGAVPGTWCVDPQDRHSAGRAEQLTALREAVDGWLAPLAFGPDAVSLPEVAAGALQVLRNVYGGRILDTESQPEVQRLAGALRSLRDGLLDVAEGGGPLAGAPFAAGATGLGVVLDDCAGGSVPPPADPGAVELLGWLELPLDDAPALVVTGFNGGKVPAPPPGDAFLSDAQRLLLGLPEERARRARDVYLCNLLIGSRDAVDFVSGRRNRQGDPLRPSRLAFHRADDEVPERVARHVEGGRVRRTHGDVALAPGREARPTRPPEPLVGISVTAFRDYLQSPYLYNLRHVGEPLESMDDGAHELDGAGFGILAHHALAGLDGKGARSRSEDEEAVFALLMARLRDRAGELFGGQALPAVAVQVEQLAARLRRFARWQADRVAQGWRILAAEWAPTAAAWEGHGEPPDGRPDGSVPFDVDGEVVALRGRIDRIEVRPSTGEWALLDYKTSDTAKRPEAVHGPRRGTGRWDDLQLPLYRLLCRPVPPDWVAAGVDPEREPELGFLSLSRDVGAPSTKLYGKAKWDADDLQAAEETARQVVRDIRRGAFPVGSFPDHDPILAAVAGVGLLSGGEDDEAADEWEDAE